MNDLKYAVVPVGGADVMTFTFDGVVYVPMRPLVEALGLHWQNEHRRITSNPILSKAVIKLMTAFSNGQEQVCLPLTHFHGWLFRLDLNTVNDRARPIIEILQREGYQVLHDYWTKGVAVNPRAAAQMELGERATAIRELPRILDRLEATRNAEKRRILHTMATRLSEQLGIDPPVLDAIGYTAAPPPDIVGAFFAAIALIEAEGTVLNHSRNPMRVAYRMPELRAEFARRRLRVPISSRLYADLRLSTDPRFIAATGVNSAITAKTETCWIFENAAASLLL